MPIIAAVDVQHFDVPHYLGILVVILATAKLTGVLAQRIGQPAVLGELVAGVLLGTSVVGLVDPKDDILHLLGELGVILLLFEIGLETDLRKLMRVGTASAAVATAGVILPFALGYGTCLLLGLDNLKAVIVSASLTATSVGITARVLADLNRLQEPESQIILGAAVIDDVIGLVILAVVLGMVQGDDVTILGVVRTTVVAFGFLIFTILLGRLVIPTLVRWVLGVTPAGTAPILAVVVAFALAWLASLAGSAMIIGAFAAGVLLRETPQAHEMERGVVHLGRFFVPLFFVTVGASVDVRSLADSSTLVIGGLLIVVAVASKFAAGYAPYWFKGDKRVIGVGMIPRGEVGLIFAQAGLDAGTFDRGLFSAVTLMVMVTTFLAPPLLKLLFPPVKTAEPAKSTVCGAELVTEA